MAVSALGSGGSAKKGPNNGIAIANATKRLNAAGKNVSALSQSYADTGNQSLQDQALASLSPLMNLAGTGLNIIGRPGQAILHSLNAFSGTKGHIDGDVLENAGKGFLKGLTDIKGKDNFNLRRTLNQDPNAGGRLAGIFDTIGTAAIDPTTYLTGGTKAVGTVGLKIIEAKLGPEIAETVAKKGLGALDTETQSGVKAAIKNSEQAGRAKKGPEGFTKDALNAIEGGKGIKFAGKTALKYNTLAPAAETAHLPQALNALKDTKAVDLLRKGFSPMAKANDLLGSKAAKLEEHIRQGRTAGDNATADVLTQVRSAIKDSGLSIDDIKTGLSGPLDGGSREGLSEPTQKLLSTLEDIRDSSVNSRKNALTSATGQSSLFEQTVPEALGRSITKETITAISRNPTQIAKNLGLDSSATPANITKYLQTHLPNEGLETANKRLSEQIGVKNAFETNPIKALTDQSVQAEREAATANTLKGLMDEVDNDGKPLISSVHRPGDVARETVLGTVYGPKEVLDELEHASITLTDDHALKTFGQIMDKWGKLWRGYATVPALFGVGFHDRNLAGNVFNMWLLGFHNPTLFNTSDKILRAIESGTNKGLTADAAIDAASKLTPEDRNLIRMARKEGIIGDSFFRTDQAVTPSVGKSNAQRVGEALNPVDSNNVVLRSGSYIGRRIEDNSRLAMFIDQMNKHGDPVVAAQNVKKALFDYSELTATEKQLKRVIPFYTYMRKNTPLQAQALLQNPGKFSTVGHGQDNLNAASADTDGKAIPQYALANGATALSGGDTPILGGLQLPFQAAAQQIQPLLALASQAPGISKDLKTEGGVGAAMRQLLGNVGGGPVDIAKFAAEEATGKSIFTGQELKPGTTKSRLAKSFIPLVGKGDSTIDDVTSSDPAVRNARLIAALSGIQTTAVTENRVEGEKARRAQVLQDLAKGTPTINELRKQGKVPKAKRSKVVKGKTIKSAKTKSSIPKAARPKLPKTR